MLRSRTSRRLLAGLLALVFSLSSPLVMAAPIEAPALPSLVDWFLGWWHGDDEQPHGQHADSEALPTLDPDGFAPAPLPPAPPTSQTTGNDGEALPTLDPNG